jgi:SAM-dependent methyltransferase
MALDDPAFVRRQYASADRLLTRSSVWRDDPASPSPHDVAMAALADLPARRLLEVGCGTGAFAARCVAELGCDVTALDLSPAMVEATQARGVPAVVGNVEDLPFGDGSFDAVAAAWMLYHVPHLDRGLAEVSRVLRPGGRLVAITNGDQQLSELWSAIGASAPRASFSRESGESRLRPWFGAIVRHDLRSTALFPDRASVAAYLGSIGVEVAPGRLARLPEPFTARGTPTVFVADRRDG